MEDITDKNAYKNTSKDVVLKLESHDAMGLNEYEARARLEKYGFNQLKEEKNNSFLHKLLLQLGDLLIIVLIISSIIYFFIGSKKDSLIIVSIVIINALIHTYQEETAEKSLESLKEISKPTGKVIREGNLRIIPSREIVIGDLISLEIGDIVPADLRLVKSNSLEIQESSLTGEPIPVEKNPNSIFSEDKDLGDRINMAYTGTVVTRGSATGIVVATGDNTELGKISTTQVSQSGLTPLQIQLNKLTIFLKIIIVLICICLFYIGYKQGENPAYVFMISISLAVVSIPRRLPNTLTILLATGMDKMTKKNIIIKNPLALETIGATTLICSNKTGTLTENKMNAVKLYVDNKIIDVSGDGYQPVGRFMLGEKEVGLNSIGDLETLLAAAALNNNSSLKLNSNGYSIIGNPTEAALLTLAKKGGVNKKKFDSKYNRIAETPFDSNRKMMTTFHENYIPNSIISFTKGAPELVINKCNRISSGGYVRTFSQDLKNKAIEINKSFSSSGLRVLAFAYKEYPSLPLDLEENNLVFIGLIGMINPTKSEAREAILKCSDAGIRTVMVTGDYRETAFFVGKDLKIANSIEDTMSGQEIDKLTEEEFDSIIKNKTIFTRISPKHKPKIIQALQDNNEITSITGSKMADTLALKKSNIGIAMGGASTDIAKDTADIIILDGNFINIVSVIEEARIIYSNIKKFIFFLLSCNIGEIFLIILSLILNLPIPLTPVQLISLNLITKSFPPLALGREKGHGNVMNTKARDTNAPIVNPSLIFRIFIQGFAIGGISLIAFKFGLQYYPNNIKKARTLVFVTLALAEFLKAFSNRSLDYTIFEIGIFSNKHLNLAVASSLALLLLVIYIPFLQKIFETFPLGINHWKTIIPLAFIPFLIGEIFKSFK